MILSILSIWALICAPTIAVPATNVTARSGFDPLQAPLGGSFPTVLGPISELPIVNRLISPDGFERSTTLAGGIFPGPLIQANKGDHFHINVVNELTDLSMPLVTSVHWHGLKQHESSWADGVSFVTQCPVPSHDSFLHKFHVPTQTGTYWYHSHFSTQYCDGLRGPLVIYDPHDPLAHMYDVDDESTVITLADWYHVPSPILNTVPGAVIPNATLINGLGRYPGGPSSPLSVVNVEHGKRYRLRIIGLSCHPWFNFTIDGHKMTVIETDGTEVDPVEVDSLAVYASQRYSVVVTADQPVDNYWIRSLSNLAVAGAMFENGQSSAILRYKGAPIQDPITQQSPSILPFIEGNLHPLINPGAPGIPEIGKADVNINLEVGFTAGNFTINNVSYVNPPAPVLLQILSGKHHALELLPSGSVYVLPPHKVVEISIPMSAAAVGGPHPFHLHGHNFDVVRVAGNSTPNFINPPRRDTVSIGNPGDNVTFRFVTDNAGPWFLHCHIDWHLNAGFAVVMAENPNGIVAHENVIPEYWFDLCPSNDTWTNAQLGNFS
ncbi:laccase [Hygrophoropsis aurantiaca]|uniref:Laccase n=1 Tax=Hygrophoropsis aurantiaca TaxID=72124 RepID=A0ACB8AM26_9AGAM|nr:laccase [Hygrophoropsis aurantiaca]